MFRILLLAVLSCITVNATAAPFTFADVVDSHDNLFYTNWGHWFTTDDDKALGAVGSNPARAAESGGTAFNFAAGYNTLKIEASGNVIAHFNVWTGPNGCESDACEFKDGFFRKVPVYGLIGIWSRSATEIIPFGDWKDITSGLGLLFIGASRQLQIPNAPSAYLFLAENDGGFADNEGFFNVRFTADVPEPGTMGLMLSGMLGIMYFGSRRLQAAHSKVR